MNNWHPLVPNSLHLFQHLPRNDDPLDLRRPLVDRRDPGIPRIPLQRQVGQVPRPAMELQRRVGRPLRGLVGAGNLHLGNYLGAIKRFVDLQATHECIYCVVDMHAITVWQDPAELKHNTREVTAAFIASGIDTDAKKLSPDLKAAREFKGAAFIEICQNCIVYNKDVFDGLSPEHQAVIQEAMGEAVATQRKAAEEADVAAFAELQELGMQYDELPPEEIEKIRAATAGVVDQIRERAGSDLVDAVLAAVKAAEG